MVRGTVVLPHGLGKSKRVCVIASGDKIKEAELAGAEIVGGDDIVEKIAGGWIDFDACVATPDMMRGVGRNLRSEEHTSELQSLAYLVCRLLLEKKKQRRTEYV